MSRMVGVLLIMSALALASGCNSSSSGGSSTDDRKTALAELGLLLKGLPADGQKPPTKQAELDPMDPMIPLAGPAIRSGEIVYYWGAGYAAGGSQVVAYEKKVPTEGGFVLLQDGSVKEMSASEFQSAPKAKK